MKIPLLILVNALLAVLLIHLVSCAAFTKALTAADIQRLIEIAQQARQASGK